MRFGLEESVIQPVPIPDAILAMLRSDSEVRTSRCVDEGQTSPDISASWFEASQIHLDGPEEIDLLVKAKDGCLFGANIGPFWRIGARTSSTRICSWSVGERTHRAIMASGHRILLTWAKFPRGDRQ